MSSETNFLSDAVNNCTIRSALRVVSFLLVHEEQVSVLRCETAVIAVKILDSCGVCAEVAGNLRDKKVCGVKISAKFVQKGVYLLGFCGATHFVSERKIQYGSTPMGGTADRQDRHGALGAGVDRRATGDDDAFSDDYAARQGKLCKDDFGVHFGDGGGVVWGVVGRDKGENCFPHSKRLATDARADSCGSTLVSPADTFDSCVEAPLNVKKKGGSSSDELNTSARERANAKVKRYLTSKPWRLSKRDRESGKVKHWQTSSEAWCRICVDSSVRCSDCDRIVQAKVAEAMLRTERARRSLEDLRLTNRITAELPTAERTERKTRDVIKEAVSGVKKNGFGYGGFAQGDKRNRKDYERIKDKDGGTPTKLLREFVSERSVDAAKYKAECQEFEQYKEYVKKLPLIRRLDLLSDNDKQLIVTNDSRNYVAGIAKLRSGDRLEVAHMLEEHELLKVLKEKQEMTTSHFDW